MVHFKSTTTTATAAFACLGAAYASVQALKVARFVWRQYLRPNTNLQQRYGSPSLSSAWAVVTGSTSGIGRGCARFLASQGFDVVLISRTVVDLEELAEELQTNYHVKTLIVTMDAAECDERKVDDVVKQLESKSVAILVNCVGIINERPTAIEEMDWSLAQRIINVNCGFAVLLTSKLVSLLKNHAAKAGHAAILNVGSLTSSAPFCYQSTYAATKAFNSQWSRCIAAELSSSNVDVLCVRPGLTSSRMTGMIPPGGIIADADDMAKRALGMLGLPVKSILPFPPHAFLDWLMTIIPEKIMDVSLKSLHLTQQHEIDEDTKKEKKDEAKHVE